jgi:REP element-mobilizing transposase RayT
MKTKNAIQESPSHIFSPTHSFTGQECPAHTGPGHTQFKSTPYEYRRDLPHYQNADCVLFVTFCKLAKDPMPDAARSIVLQHCLHDYGSKLRLHVAVVMPEHVHLLLTPLRDDRGWPYALRNFLKLIKGTSARSVNKFLGREGPVWQEESFDHVLRSWEKFEEKREYIRQNPYGGDWWKDRKTIRGSGKNVGRTLLSG